MVAIFDVEQLHAIAKRAVGMDSRSAAFEQILGDLIKQYPEHVRRDVPWLFNNAGGAMGQMKLLHASLSEYLILFGSPIGTEGHSGRYSAEVWDFIIDGEVWAYQEGELDRQTFGPGEFAYLGGGRVKGYAIPDGAYMLEYARGRIPTMMLFGIADSLFSTVDAPTVGKTAWYYAKMATAELLKGKF